MQSQVEELSPVLIAVKIEVPWDTIAQDLEQAYRKAQKTAKVRGFRPGKVPRNVVKKLMGPSVRNEVGNAVVQKGIGAAIDEHSLDPIAIPDVDAGEFEEGSAYTFTAKMEIRPAIGELKLDGLDVERKLIRVPEGSIDAELDRLREQNGELVSPEPVRASQARDVLTFSATLCLEGTDRPDLSVDETQAQLGEGGLLPEIEAGLTGLSIGEERAIDVNFPEDYGHADLKGKSAQLTVSLKEVQEKRLPDLDDEFAKDLEHDSLDAMKASIREKLEQNSTQRADAEVREAVIKKLIDDNPVPAPPSMVEQQHRAMIQEMMQFQRYMGKKMDLPESAMDGMKGESERKVQAGLLLGEIAKRESLAVTSDEVEQEFTKIAERTGQHIAKVRAEHQGDARGNLESRLLENKLLEYLLSKATITETEVDEETSGDSK